MTPRPLVLAASLTAVMLVGCSESGPEAAPAANTKTSAITPTKTNQTEAASTSKPANTPAAAPIDKLPPPVAPALPAIAKAQAEPVGDPIDPLSAAQADLQARKFDDAIAKLETVLKTKPDDRRALFALVMSTQAKATDMASDPTQRKASIPTFLRSAEVARKLRAQKDLSPRDSLVIGQALYNEACSLAIDGKGDAAMAALNEAFDAGFNDMATFEKDDELNSLRKRPDFDALQKGIGGRMVARLFKENKPFPFTFNLPDLDGKPVSLDELKGKVVIVDIWGTWCPPCRKEIPHFVDLYKTYHEKGLEIVGLNYNEEGSPEQVNKTIKTFLAENKVPYRCAVGDEKTQAQVTDLEGYPTTLFLDRAGKVRLKLVGYTEKDQLEAIVKTLLDEK